jgi:hypothetical protein
MFSQILHLILCIGVHGLGSLAMLVEINFYLLFYPRSTNVCALSQFLLYIFRTYTYNL